ncbi:MAG TPA: helix-turn-helix transcriptional regulator [Puia sp.]|jgi:transcriptional regulator with XRE-family HTH domain|nr:helix-turn-helix transcriptional regulator [Puia sp.]
METEEFSQELIKLGVRIRQLRKHRKLKLLDLEVLSGINDSDLSRYERGKENIEFLTIYKLAKALEVEIALITDYDGDLPDNVKFKGLGKANALSTRKRKSTRKN